MAFWKIFQKMADRIQALEWSPEMKVTIQNLNDMLPKAVADGIMKYIEEQYLKSEDIAKASLKQVQVKLSEAIKNITG